ncbi:MAG: arginine--tRNA ligase [Bacilli bacterium]|nr:arginine--tRNA ligase [Bacilli bacterium]
MSKFKELEEKLTSIVKDAGYDVEVALCQSNRPDLGEYQVNDAMKLAKEYHKSPVVIANEILEKMKEHDIFTNLNIAGAGFINISLSDKFLIDYINEIKNDITKNVDKQQSKKIMIDYGGANVAKALHVGHLRSPNIGEALKRLANLLGHETIGDVHLGDSGLQAGIVVQEMKERFPDLPCFKEDYDGSDFELPITEEDLKEIYPTGSRKTKEDETLLENARQITFQIQKNHLGYSKLWDKVSALSIKGIKKTYDKLNTSFELWEGERDSFKYIPEMMEYLNSKGLTYISEGATVMDVKEETDDKEIPPIILQKSDGAYLYATTDLATIYSRIKRFNPDEIWYTTDLRQELHFEQVFRAATKSKISENVKLGFFGFGTMNGPDGKPFKTRSGGVMSLDELIEIIKDECYKRINDNIVEKENKEKLSEEIAIAALKYADLLPYRATDYIFDPAKFSDLDGKTGPYLLYSTIRIKSLLKKAEMEGIKYENYTKLKGKTERDVIITLLNMPSVITRAYESKSLNEVAEYIYKLTSIYNKFYSENKIIIEEDNELRESWLVLSKTIYDTNMLLLDLMGIKCPEKM